MPLLRHLRPGEEIQVRVETDWGAPGLPSILKDVCRDLWNVTDERPRFLPRKAVLDDLHGNLQADGYVTLKGQPGSGKTQTAVAYARRHQDEYQAVFWVNAASDLNLRTDYAALARTLELPERDDKSEKVVKAVRRWLNQERDWLLIIDNVGDNSSLKDYLPDIGRGRVLLVQRPPEEETEEAVPGTRKTLSRLSGEAGALFLLRRTGLLTDEADVSEGVTIPGWSDALALSVELGGSPLALDLAGALIADRGMDLYQYRALCHARAAQLPEYGNSDHASEETYVPIQLALEWAVQTYPALADVLRLCVFLAPDGVSEEVFTSSGLALLDLPPKGHQWPQVISLAQRLSLLHRDSRAKTLTVHSLILRVVREAMSDEERRDYAMHAVQAVESVFPAPEFANWPVCDRLLPQVRACATWIEQYGIASAPAKRLLHRAGSYLTKRAQYTEAKWLLTQRLMLVGGKEHLEGITHSGRRAHIGP